MLEADPVEQVVLDELKKLKKENKKLKDQLYTTTKVTLRKPINDWKPFDFYGYFCKLYQEKYNLKYPAPNNLVREYNRIKAFKSKNKITNEEYKSFIEKSFSLIFNSVRRPTIAHMCNPSMYKSVTGKQDVASPSKFELDLLMSYEEKEDEYVYKPGMTVGELLAQCTKK